MKDDKQLWGQLSRAEKPTVEESDERIKGLLRKSRRISVLTGAGVSTEAGIPDFKSTDETWPYEEPRDALLSAPYWRKDPRSFWEVYRSTLRATELQGELEPTRFHRWLVDLEHREETTFLEVLTQNVDGLHTKAGSSKVTEAHGNSSRAICIECRNTFPMVDLEGDLLPTCPICGFPPLKPDISLFFEGVHGVGEFRTSLDWSDLLIVAGTGLQVGPVNELPFYAQRYMVPTLWISNDEPPEDYRFTHLWIGDLGEFTERFPTVDLSS